MYDVVIIGGGIVGTSALYYLSQQKLRVLLLEAESDLSEGTTKANSGIVHAGYDCTPDTKKARFNREGNPLCYELAEKLGVACKKTGSLVLGKSDGLDSLMRLKARGEQNGITGLSILSRNEILKIEPNIADEIEYALRADSGGIISPYKFCYALADYAVANGAMVGLNKKVTAISKSDGVFTLTCADNSQYQATVIVNAAGAAASEINRLAGEAEYETRYRRGDYFLLDTSEQGFVNSVCFQLPSAAGKGILVTPTVDGNILVGPTSIPVDGGDDRAVKREALSAIRSTVAQSIKDINFRAVIRVFAGVRSISGEDFVIENGRDKNFIYTIGICSPGLTAAPAIGKHIAETLLKSTSLRIERKSKLTEYRQPPDNAVLSESELNNLIKTQPSYGKIVCRCEHISEGEIIAAIHAPVPAVTIDAVKRRTRASMGRCQGGFCTHRVMQIIARELKSDIKSVTKNGAGSEVAVSEVCK